MRTDVEIRRDVESELEWDPSSVVKDGFVTLSGKVR